MERKVTAPVLQTERLVLRPHRLEDAARWYQIQSSSTVLSYISWPERNREQSWAHLKQRTRHVELSQADDFLALAIEQDGKLVGDVSLHLRSVSPASRSAEISWILHPDHCGQGFATEAVAAAMEFAFTRAKVRLLVADIDPRNAASIALAQRLGFREIAQGGITLSFIAGAFDR